MGRSHRSHAPRRATARSKREPSYSGSRWIRSVAISMPPARSPATLAAFRYFSIGPGDLLAPIACTPAGSCPDRLEHQPVRDRGRSQWPVCLHDRRQRSGERVGIRDRSGRRTHPDRLHPREQLQYGFLPVGHRDRPHRTVPVHGRRELERSLSLLDRRWRRARAGRVWQWLLGAREQRQQPVRHGGRSDGPLCVRDELHTRNPVEARHRPGVLDRLGGS